MCVWAGVNQFLLQGFVLFVGLHIRIHTKITKGYHCSVLLNYENNKCNTLSFYRLNDCTSLVKRGVSVVHFTLRPVHDPGINRAHMRRLQHGARYSSTSRSAWWISAGSRLIDSSSCSPDHHRVPQDINRLGLPRGFSLNHNVVAYFYFFGPLALYDDILLLPIHHPSCIHHIPIQPFPIPAISFNHTVHYFRAICIHPASLLPIYDPQSASLPESVMEVVSLQFPGTGRRPSEIIIVKGDSRSTEGDSREFNYFI